MTERYMQRGHFDMVMINTVYDRPGIPLVEILSAVRMQEPDGECTLVIAVKDEVETWAFVATVPKRDVYTLVIREGDEASIDLDWYTNKSYVEDDEEEEEEG